MEEPGGATSLRRANDVAHARASRRARPSRPSRTGERGESARRSSMSCSRTAAVSRYRSRHPPLTSPYRPL